MTAKKTDDKSGGQSHGDSVILVGNKNVMSYVLACVTLFNKGAEEGVIKARGRLISRAVDVAEITRHRFISELKVKKIEIDTTTGGGMSFTQIDTLTIDNCTIHDVATGGITINADQNNYNPITNVIVSNCTVYNCAS